MYEPDVGLLFGKEGNGDAGHSPLSASWSAVLSEDSSIPSEDERITFSNGTRIQFPANDSVVRTVMFVCPSGHFPQYSH